MNKVVVIFIFLVAISLNVLSQKQYSFLQVNNTDGMVSNRVTCVHKDSRGFVWIGTKSGLSRYDGNSFVNYKHNSNDSTSIMDNHIRNICEDAKGNLLISTSLGYTVYDYRKEKFHRNINEYLGFKSGTPVIREMYCDNDKRIWIKPMNQLDYSLLTKDSTLVSKLNNNKTENVEVWDFKHANSSYYYLYSNGIIECYDDATYELKFTDDFLLHKIKGGSLIGPNIFIDKENDIWFYGNDQGVFHYKVESKIWHNYSINSEEVRLSSNIIYEVIQDDKGLIWVATDHGGINIINKYSREITILSYQSDNNKSLADNSVTDLYIDDNNIIWAATNKNGVSYYHESIHQFPHLRNLLSDKSSLPFSDVNCFLEDKEGNLWIGTNGGGLVYFNRAKNSYTSYKHQKHDTNSISSNVVMCLHIDKNEDLWLGTYAGGVNRFDGERFERFQFNASSARGLTSNNVWSIIEDAKRNIWISTNGGGVLSFDYKTETFTELPNKGKKVSPTPHIAALYNMSDGNVLVGTAYGAYIYDTNEQCYKTIPGLDSKTNSNNKSVNGVFEDSRGLFWLATNEGLIVVDPKISFVKHFNSQDGLPEDMMNCIEEDEFKTIWVSKSTGLSQIMVSKSARDKDYDFKIYHFTEEDGLQANEFNPNASYRTRDNELIFGGINGFNIFKSKNIKSNEVLPKVLFTDFQVYNQSILPDQVLNNRKLLNYSISSTQKVELKNAMNVFSIGFAALDFFIPAKIRYKYKLEGFNDEWLDLDNSLAKVTYTNLDAGDYYFRVKASNNDGVWNDEFAELQITVLPPLYATPFAFVLYILIIVGFLLYYRYSTQKKERLKLAIEQERIQAKQNQDMDEMKLRFLTNVSHEFRTPLTLILTPLQKLLGQIESNKDRKLLEVIDRNARNLLGLVNQLLDFRKLELHGMQYNPSFGNVVVFLNGVMEDFQQGFQKKNIEFVFEHELGGFMLNFDRDKLQKVMMNLLSNALKFTPEHGRVTMKLSVDSKEEMVQISVSDTGVGIKNSDIEKIFVRFYQSDNNKKLGLSGSGIGLNLAREMVQLHNGTIEVDSTEGKGATFTVTLPVERVKVDEHKENAKAEIEEAILEHDVDMNANEKPVVLLVEDNEDFRTFMKETLEDKFTVHEAADGQIAYAMVHKVLPDIVISDVMMPNIDGLELCKMLRKDIRTSHIPLILLTARTEDEDKIKGLENGADEYITKPFNMDLLLLRVKHLLQKRSKMQKQFQKTIDINPSEVQITSMDEKLIKKAVATVEENLSVTGFSVEDLSKELGMSRVHLYKKLVAITGKSPIEFMRIIRLKRGVQLLEKSQLSIAEVAYQVGFNSPRYFSKYFKEQYGMLPSAYVKSKAIEEE